MKRFFIPSLILLFVFAIASGYLLFIQSTRNRINVSRTAVIKELQELNRLETASFTIEKIIDAKTDTSNRLQEILFGDKLLLVAHGEVIAGIDLSSLSEKDITIQDTQLSIRLPASQILVVKIDNQKTRVYDRQTGFFSKGDKDLEAEAREAAEDAILQAACDANILDLAATNARRQLSALFQTLGFETIMISIPVGNCR